MSEDAGQPAPEDLFLLVLVAIMGYEKETGKTFSVDKNVLREIYEAGIENNEMPELALTHAEDRLEIQIRMEKVIDDDEGE